METEALIGGKPHQYSPYAGLIRIHGGQAARGMLISKYYAIVQGTHNFQNLFGNKKNCVGVDFVRVCGRFSFIIEILYNNIVILYFI
jgi:hypothetical protein